MTSSNATRSTQNGAGFEGFSDFSRSEAASALVLLASAIVALVLANSRLADAYDSLWHIEAGLRIGGFAFGQDLRHWVDDALMAVFFLVVGLEIKREMLVGELKSPRQALLPIVAALGGMLVPAALYLALAGNGEAGRGWGVPMATDIAFVLGVMALLGPRVPSALKVFLVALAIVDDIGAILVIALFYTESVATGWLLAAAAIFVVLVVLNRFRVRFLTVYLLLGIALWFCVFSSGLHATLAGVLLAMAIPARARMSTTEFTDFTRRRIDEIEACHVPDSHVLEAHVQERCTFEIIDAAEASTTPLQRLEFGLLPLSSFVVLPLFALANAGVTIETGSVGAVFAGVAAGLLLGKPAGIVGGAWIAVRLGWADLPAGVSWPQLAGAGILGGIGFTMSLFVANLAFDSTALLAEAKLAVLAASVVAGISGYALLGRLGRVRPVGGT